MQVAIYGRDDLDTLQNWATQYFGDIPNRNLNKPYPIPHPYSNGYTSRIIVYKPLESTPFIKIIWQTPSLQDKYRYRVSVSVTFLRACSHSQQKVALIEPSETMDWSHLLASM